MTTLLFRAMKQDSAGQPVCADTARGLGARVPPADPADIVPDRGGDVHPETGGMSVTPGDPMGLPVHRRPPELQGWGKDPVFEIRVV